MLSKYSLPYLELKKSRDLLLQDIDSMYLERSCNTLRTYILKDCRVYLETVRSSGNIIVTYSCINAPSSFNRSMNTLHKTSFVQVHIMGQICIYKNRAL